MAGFTGGYALIVGVAHYERVSKLSSVVLKDAQDLYRLLNSSQKCGYLTNNIRLLLDNNATADAMRAGMQWLAQAAPPTATVILFFSGHGGLIDTRSHTDNYLLPYDTDLGNLATTAISGSELTRMLHSIKAQRLLVIFDCCHSGGIGDIKQLGFGQGEFKVGIEETFFEKLADGKGRVIIASSRSDEVSWILPHMRNSLFTHYLLDALRGKAHSRGDGLIRVSDVFDYVSREVSMRAEQHPIFKANIENNFPIALYEGGKQMNVIQSTGTETVASVDKVALRDVIVQAFSLEELEILCDELQQHLDNVDIKKLSKNYIEPPKGLNGSSLTNISSKTV